MDILEYADKCKTSMLPFIQNSFVLTDVNSITISNNIYSEVVAFSQKGKAIRGTLVCLGHALASDDAPNELVLKTAAAVELNGSGLLIHDDIMDNDDLRRGESSMHVRLQSFAPEGSDVVRYGTSQAIVVGDALFFAAHSLMSSAPAEIHQLYAKEMENVARGQLIDYHFCSSSNMPERSEILDMYRLKTAGYSIAAPLSIGAILGGASKDLSENIYKAGIHIGLAYQVSDDMLSIFGDTKKIGKAVGSDIRENKKTILLSLLIELANENEIDACLKAMREPTSESIESVITLMKKYDIQKAAQLLMEENMKEAQKILGSLKLRDETRTTLDSLCDFVVSRNA